MGLNTFPMMRLSFPRSQQQIELLRSIHHLISAERHKIQNRSCTVRQRRRLYQYKITCYDIDRRFAIRTIKQMLDDSGIKFTAMNKVKSKWSNTAILYVGVYNVESIRRHTPLIRTLFTERNYNRIYKRNHNYPSTMKYYS
jgi:hypothetical protein